MSFSQFRILVGWKAKMQKPSNSFTRWIHKTKRPKWKRFTQSMRCDFIGFAMFAEPNQMKTTTWATKGKQMCAFCMRNDAMKFSSIETRILFSVIYKQQRSRRQSRCCHPNLAQTKREKTLRLLFVWLWPSVTEIKLRCNKNNRRDYFGLQTGAK